MGAYVDLDQSLTLALLAIGALTFFGLLGLAFTSLLEGERRATGLALAAAVAAAALLTLAALAPPSVRLVAGVVVAVGAVVILVLLAVPMGKAERGPDVPQVRVDERTIMFARASLEPGSPEYAAYYAAHPQDMEGDDRTRSLPGIGSPEAAKANRLVFAAMEASFSLTEALREDVDGPVASEKLEIPPEVATHYLRNVARYWGARNVGVAETKSYHVYSHVGRGTGIYGEPITLDHRYALAFTVEMDFHMMGPSPDAPVVMESSRQYVEASKVALQLAWLVRSLGYVARAHIDGNYRVIAPLVARDAGLGEIGRMGLLMTPDLGPRVRLGVVTTDLPLVPDGRIVDPSVLDFCAICEKCADNCPSRSIPRGDREMVAGALRWRINPDTCFRYWNSLGTDCGRCMAVCPYSHPDTVLHDIVRYANRRSGFARRATLRLDDVFYGRKPAARPAPDWIPARGQTIGFLHRTHGRTPEKNAPTL